MSDHYFGRFFDLLKANCAAGGSELAVGLTLFSLTASLRAKTVYEIGRYKGFSALAIGSGLKLLDEGWVDPPSMHSRPDMDWGKHEQQGVERRCYSIDPAGSFPEGDAMWRDAGVDQYIVKINERSQDAKIDHLPEGDMVFVDGSHARDHVMADADKYLSHLRPGGLAVFHDYFGPYDNGANISGVKDVIAVLSQERYRRWVLLDTGYPSMAIVRKHDPRVHA